MNISHIPKAKVLAALFNAAKPFGSGYIQYNPNHIMSEDEASKILEGQVYFDYLEGRLMKVNLSLNELDTSNYNRDNGAGAAEAVINEIKA